MPEPITAFEIGKTIALALLAKKAGQIYDEVVGSVDLANLQRTVITDLSNFTRQAVSDAFIQERLAAADDAVLMLQRHMEEYNNAPSDDRLSWATNESQRLMAALENERIGMCAHHVYFIAGGLRLAVLQEREKRYGSAERKNVWEAVKLYSDHGAHLQMLLGNWLTSQLTDVYEKPPEGCHDCYRYCFKCFGDEYCEVANIPYILEDGTIRDPLTEDEARAAAEQRRLQITEERIVPVSQEKIVPAIEIQNEWYSLQRKYENEIVQDNYAYYLQRVRDHAEWSLVHLSPHMAAYWTDIHAAAVRDAGANSGPAYNERVKAHTEWVLIANGQRSYWRSIDKAARNDTLNL
jgi:hypothetical protein